MEDCVVETGLKTANVGEAVLDEVATLADEGAKTGITRSVKVVRRVGAEAHHVPHMPREREAIVVYPANEKNTNLRCKKRLKPFSFNSNGEGNESGSMKELLLQCIRERDAHLAEHGELGMLFQKMLDDYILNLLVRL